MNRKNLLQLKPRGFLAFKRRGGSTIVLAMLVVVVSVIVGLGLISLGLNSRIFTYRNASEIAARCTADAGLARAIFEMNKRLDNGTLDLDYPDNYNPTIPTSENEELPGCDSTFSYTITQDAVDQNAFLVESVGKYSLANKTVSANIILQQTSPFEYAVFTGSRMVLENNCMIDGYNGGEGGNLKIGSNTTVGGNLQWPDSALINGDVVVGPGGDPCTVINADPSTYDEAYALPEENELPPVVVPDWLAAMPSGGTIGACEISESGKYDSIILRHGDILRITGPVSLYIQGQIAMNNSQLQISNTHPDASLTLYIAGQIDTKNGSQLNNLTMDPHKLLIYGLDGFSGVGINSTFYGAIYAPTAQVKVTQGSRVYGSIVADCLVQAQSSAIHYDASLTDVCDQGGQRYFAITRWSE